MWKKKHWCWRRMDSRWSPKGNFFINFRTDKSPSSKIKRLVKPNKNFTETFTHWCHTLIIQSFLKLVWLIITVCWMLTQNLFNMLNMTTFSVWVMLLTYQLPRVSTVESLKFTFLETTLKEDSTVFLWMLNMMDTLKLHFILTKKISHGSAICTMELNKLSILPVSPLDLDTNFTQNSESTKLLTSLNSRTGDHHTTNSRRLSKEEPQLLLHQDLSTQNKKLHDLWQL